MAMVFVCSFCLPDHRREFCDNEAFLQHTLQWHRAQVLNAPMFAVNPSTVVTPNVPFAKSEAGSDLSVSINEKPSQNSKFAGVKGAPPSCESSFTQLKGYRQTFINNFNLFDPTMTAEIISNLSEAEKDKLSVYVPRLFYLQGTAMKDFKSKLKGEEKACMPKDLKDASSYCKELNAKKILSNLYLSKDDVSETKIKLLVQVTDQLMKSIANCGKEEIRCTLLTEVRASKAVAGCKEVINQTHLKEQCSKNPEMRKLVCELLDQVVFPNSRSAKHTRNALAVKLCNSCGIKFKDGNKSRDCIRLHVSTLWTDVKSEFITAAGTGINSVPKVRMCSLPNTASSTTVSENQQYSSFFARTLDQDETMAPPRAVTTGCPGAHNTEEGLPRTDSWSSAGSKDSLEDVYWAKLAKARKEKEEAKATKARKKADLAVVVAEKAKEEDNLKEAAAAQRKKVLDQLAVAAEVKKQEKDKLLLEAAAANQKKQEEDKLEAAAAQRKKVGATVAKKKEEEKLKAAAAQRKKVGATVAKKKEEEKLKAAAAQRKKVLDDLAVAAEEKTNKEYMLKAQTKSTGKRSQSTTNPDVSTYICTIHCHRREDLIVIPPHEVKAYLKSESTYDTTVLLATSNCSQCSKSAKDIGNNVSIHRCIDCQKEMEATLADDNSIGGRRFPWMCGACYSSGASGSSRRRKKWSKHHG
jgi:hypothetical protein